MEGNNPLRRIGGIGDIHGEVDSLEVAINFFSTANVDLIMAVGDITDGPGSIDRCCELLQKYNVATVRGNHERWFLAGQMRDLPDATFETDINEQTRKFLSSLPTTLVFETVGGRLLLCHGLGENDMGGVWPDDDGYALESNIALLRLKLEGEYKYVGNEHIHMRMVRNIENLTIINAGTLFREHNPCFLIADIENRYVQFYEIKNKKVTKAVIFQLVEKLI